MAGFSAPGRIAGIVGLAMLALAGPLHALSTGPTRPRTDAPNELNCTGCHHSPNQNVNGTIVISFSGGSTYTPGVWKRVTITITPSPSTAAQVKYGFQASARVGTSRAGRFDIINDNSQTMAVKCATGPTATTLTDRPAGGNCGATDLEYIQHNQPYGGVGSVASTVSFLWQPPASNVGDVKFYATSVLGVSPYANGTYPYSTSTTLTYQAPGTAPNPVYPAGSLGVEALDTPSNKIVATRTVTANPIYKTTIKRDGSRLYALTLRGDQLLMIDPRNGALLNTIPVVGTALALSPDESRVYVVGHGTAGMARLFVFDAATGASLGNPLEFLSSDWYFAAAPSPDGSRIYTAPTWSSPMVVVIDAATVSQLPSITTSASPVALAVSPDSSRLLVATVDTVTGASWLEIYSTVTRALLAPPIQLDPIARGVVFSPDGTSAYVLTQDATHFIRITTIQVATASPVAQFWFPSPGYSYFFRISPDGAYFYGGGNANPGGQPSVYAWSVPLAGSPVAIPSAQGILDIAVPLSKLTPDPFSFTALSNVPLSTVQTSTAATITGINTASPISVSGGVYSIGCTTTYGSSPSTITNGQTVCLRHTSSSSYSTSVTTTLNIGGVQGTFTSTTAADTVPNPFSFASLTGVQVASPQVSSSTTISGISAPSPISVTGGEYAIGCTGAFTSAAAAIANGQTVCVRHVAAASYSQNTVTTLTIGGVNGTFTTTTVAPCGDFPDVSTGDFYCSNVEWLRNRHVTLGCGAGIYCPNDTVQRSAMAAFMNRLGTAISIVPSLAQGSLGALDPTASPRVCEAAPIAAADYPRTVDANWFVTGLSTGALGYAVRTVRSTDGGSTWVDLDGGLRSGTASARWSALGGASAIDLAAGVELRLGIRIDRPAGGGSATFTQASCQLLVQMSNRNPASPPLDPRSLGGLQ